MHRAFILVWTSLLSVVLCANVYGQGIEAGTWRYHAFFGRDSLLTISPKKVYTSYGTAIMTYDRATGNLDNLTKNDGLTDVNVTALAHAYTKEVMLIGYRSGMIDIREGSKTTQIDGLVRARISVSKAIKNIDIIDNQAFVTGDFGFLVVDLTQKVIKSSNTSLDATGGNQAISVVSVCKNQGRLYFGTTRGIYSIGAAENLQDSRLFTLETFGANGLPITGGALRSVRAASGVVYAVFSLAGVYYKTASGWEPITGSGVLSSPFRGLTALNNKLLLSAGGEIYQIINLTYQLIADSTGPVGSGAPGVAYSDKEGEIWVADRGSGLLRLTENNAEAFQTTSPGFSTVFRLYGYKDKMVAMPGGYYPGILAQFNNTEGIGVFQNNFWTYKKPGKELPATIRDICSATYNKRLDALILSCYGSGLAFVPEKTGNVTMVNDTTKTRDGNLLENAIPGQITPAMFVRVPYVSSDANGNIWATNFSANVLHLRDLDEKWYAYKVPEPGPVNAASGVQIVLDDQGTKYIRMEARRSNQDLSVLVRSADNKKWGIISKATGKGGLPNEDVYDIAVDKDGALWLGTGAGLAVIYNPTAALTSEPFNATLPIFDGRPLLENDICTSIMLDGGGRKWVGTRNSGIWLFDKDVSRVLANFTTDNSPLPSNDITDMAFVPTTGEVFIGTADGLVSYNSVAPDPDAQNQEQVRVYPSPIRPGYTGNIGIDNLPENAVVKITDAAGRLVFEGRAAGGGIMWNGMDYSGRRPQAGIYFIYAYSESKALGLVGKFAVID